ncbi:hypothetical protein ACH5RR_028907 [Cinchona calisaya]|uniref:Uncharacterized protein n=1 Tax=Cinchona calisaya TaxID=153742 RepID=A0ABD2YRJ9_9GENT
MSVLQYPEGVNSSSDLQIWNNAAFDNGESEDSSAIIERSWSSLKPHLLDPSDSLESFSSKEKENQSPLLENSSVSSLKSPTPLPLKVLDPNGAVEKSRIKSVKGNYKLGFIEKTVSKSGAEGEVRDEGKIDKEIEEIEKEINRLSSRLEALRIEKAEKSLKMVEKRGKIVAAKFMDQKLVGKNAEEKKKIEEILAMSARNKVHRRGLSMGPSEIMAGARRGMSLGPSEIFSDTKSGQFGRKESLITPVQSIKNRRKSCFWKLQDIEEEKVTKERGKSLSVSPKSRKNLATKTQASRQAMTTVASKKAVKKEDLFGNSVQPKKLFKDGEKSVNATNKKPLRPGRVVASRYNQSISQASAMRKRSLPENDKDESNRGDKKRSLSVGKSREMLPEKKNLGTESSRVKKRWEIPSDLVVHSSESEDSSPTISVVVPEILPRIRIARCINETPRDSGPAKRVADLIGRKQYFAEDEEVVEPSFCQVLSFADDEA